MMYVTHNGMQENVRICRHKLDTGNTHKNMHAQNTQAMKQDAVMQGGRGHKTTGAHKHTSANSKLNINRHGYTK